MRIIFLFLTLIGGEVFGNAQSHPGWWTFVAPDSKSLVGIEWQNLHDSAFGEVVGGELASSGSFGFPDLPCLMNSRDFLISSPPLLAGANGGCSMTELRSEAAAKGMKRVAYRGFELWIAPGATLSAVQINDRVVLIGTRKSLEGAIDRGAAENRTYSPLLMIGAKLAKTRDLWVSAMELPDPLAGIFVPLDVPESGTLHNFEGGLSTRDGLTLGAIVDAGSDRTAAEFAAGVRKNIPQLPAIAKGLQVVSTGSTVTLALQVAKAELDAALRRTPPDNGVESTPTIAISPSAAPQTMSFPPRPDPVKPEIAKVVVAKVEPVKVEPVKSEPAKPHPQVIRIFGLDDGPREIVLPVKEPH